MNIHLVLHDGSTEPVRVEVSGNRSFGDIPTYEFRPYRFGYSNPNLRPSVSDDL